MPTLFHAYWEVVEFYSFLKHLNKMCSAKTKKQAWFKLAFLYSRGSWKNPWPIDKSIDQSISWSVGLATVQVLQRLQLLNQLLVLLLQRRYPVLQTLHVLFLLPSTLLGRFSATNRSCFNPGYISQIRKLTISDHFNHKNNNSCKQLPKYSLFLYLLIPNLNKNEKYFVTVWNDDHWPFKISLKKYKKIDFILEFCEIKTKNW